MVSKYIVLGSRRGQFASLPILCCSRSWGSARVHHWVNDTTGAAITNTATATVTTDTASRTPRPAPAVALETAIHKMGGRIEAPHSLQPLLEGEGLARRGVNAVMPKNDKGRAFCSHDIAAPPATRTRTHSVATPPSQPPPTTTTATTAATTTTTTTTSRPPLPTPPTHQRQDQWSQQQQQQHHQRCHSSGASAGRAGGGKEREGERAKYRAMPCSGWRLDDRQDLGSRCAPKERVRRNGIRPGIFRISTSASWQLPLVQQEPDFHRSAGSLRK